MTHRRRWSVIVLFTSLVLLTGTACGTRVCETDLPAETGSSVTECQLKQGTEYTVYIQAKNPLEADDAPATSQPTSTVRVKGRLETAEGGDVQPFSIESQSIDDWSWETERNETEWKAESMGTFRPKKSATHRIVLEELELDPQAVDSFKLYVWKSWM